MTKIICTGNPAHGGIAKSLQKYYPDTKFISKNLGFDLTSDSDYFNFLEIAKEYDVFINHSQIYMGFQEKALNDVYNLWTRGHIITIGSVLEFDEWRKLDTITSNEKLSTRNRSLILSSENIKTTHLITSGFQRYGLESDIKIDPDDIIYTISFVLNSTLDFPLIYVDKIDDIRFKKWRNIINELP
jgi:hypothetical protein